MTATKQLCCSILWKRFCCISMKRNELSENDMARLEWAYLPLLTHSRREPKALEDFLARSPTFFVEVLSALYRPDPESGVVENEHANSEHAAAVAKQAFDLSQSWRRVPGSDGATIDAAALKSWMTEARTLSAKVGRGRIADQTIGHVPAKAGKDADGFWPPIGIRDAIESARSRELEQGIAIGVLNKQGVTVRSPTDGGSKSATLRRSIERLPRPWHRSGGERPRYWTGSPRISSKWQSVTMKALSAGNGSAERPGNSNRHDHR